MSARSASARKKITDTQSKSKKPITSSRRPPPIAPVPEFRQYSHYGEAYRDAQSYGSRSPLPDANLYSPRRPMSIGGHSSESGSHSGPSDADGLDNTGIERSGFRSLMDKRSDGVRRGLAKTFAFKKKDKEEPGGGGSRPESQATVRQGALSIDTDGTYGFEDYQHSLSSSTQHGNISQRHLNFPPPPNHHHYPVSPKEPMENTWPGPPPTTKLPAVPHGGGPSIRRFVGSGRASSRWNKLRKDPELWDPNGDVLVYLNHKESGDAPSLRLSSHIIEATRSRYLITLLRDGFVQDGDELAPPRRDSYWGQPTPPVSEADDIASGDVSYEMYFPPPPSNSGTEVTRHQITTRNMFAMIYRSSLVGLSLYQALCDLLARLEKYRSTGEAEPFVQLQSYLSARGLIDTRGDVESSVAILAFTERPGVQWASAWREAFIHCAGMYDQKLESAADWRHVIPLTKALLERSWLEMRLRIQTAEERLMEFSFADIWSGSSSQSMGSNSTSAVGSPQAASERLRDFLISHYSKIYGSWPPSVKDGHDSEDQMWLTRSVSRALQHDFAALYDYLVDRDIIWDVSEARAGRKWIMASEDDDRPFEADIVELPLTDMLIEHDNRSRLPHIPHPHPLLPESIPPQSVPTSTGGMFKSAQPPRHAGRERRVALAYTDSTNIDILGDSYSQSALVEAFTRFEKSDCVTETDPQMARRGRWVLIYGILQSLVAVGMDAPGLKHCDNVFYHLSAKVKKPSWCREAGIFGDVKHEMSHCWVVPQTWQSREDEEQGDNYNEHLPPSPLSPPGLSASASEAGSSVRSVTSPGAHAYRREHSGGLDRLEIPYRHRNLNEKRTSAATSAPRLSIFPGYDQNRDPRCQVGGDEPTVDSLSVGHLSSPIIIDFDEER